MFTSRLTSRIATTLAVTGAGFIGYIGVRYMADPQAMAPSFGFKTYPTGDAADFLNVKGVRDVISGLVPVALLVAGQRKSAGIAMLVTALIPTGDMLSILRHDGSTATALGVHGVTAALVALTGVLLVNERTAETRAVTA
ncbi:DUF4267 domain-containing protein [Nocardia sp. NPDC059240]|uniref:DUF4267 domain-containing protein n=1 Tax=Nocardia sp. NPDC059240 TaxID=3346786 RepID=UPI00368E5C45